MGKASIPILVALAMVALSALAVVAAVVAVVLGSRRRKKETFVGSVAADPAGDGQPYLKPYFSVQYTPPPVATVVAVTDDARLPDQVYQAWRDEVPGIKFATDVGEALFVTTDLMSWGRSGRVEGETSSDVLCVFHDAFKFLTILGPPTAPPKLSDLVRHVPGHEILCPSVLVADLVRVVCQASGLPSPNIEVRQAGPEDVLIAPKGENSTAGRVIAIWTCASSTLVARLLSEPIRVLTYDDDVDPHKLRLLAPLAFAKDIDIVDVFPRVKLPDDVRVVKAVCSPVVAVVVAPPPSKVSEGGGVRGHEDAVATAGTILLTVAKRGVGREWTTWVGANNHFELRGMRLLDTSRELFREWNAQIAQNVVAQEREEEGTGILPRSALAKTKEGFVGSDGNGESDEGGFRRRGGGEKGGERGGGRGGHERMPFVVRPTRNVPCFARYYDGGTRVVLTLANGSTDIRGMGWEVDGMVLRPGDRIELRFQNRNEENGTYHVGLPPTELFSHAPIPLGDFAWETMETANDEDAVRLVFGKYDADARPHYRVPLAVAAPFLLQTGDRVRLGGESNGIVVDELVSEDAVIVRLDSSAPAVVATDTILDKGTAQNGQGGESDKYHPLARCLPDTTVHVRELCLAKGGVWDRPCERNSDCPFFQANTTYKNYRGGCIDGYCEMPIGVERVGYRHRRADQTPMCHGGACDPRSPDLAFPFDEFDRLASRS